MRLKPGDVETLGNLGVYLMPEPAAEGIARLDEAQQELAPKAGGAQQPRPVALLGQNRLDEAAVEFGMAARLDPNDAATQFNLGRTLMRLHKTKEADGHYRAAVRLKPDFAEAMSNLAWLLSTDADPQLRNGGEAAQLAEKACDLTHYQQAGPVLSTAAARAETGQFGEAAAGRNRHWNWRRRPASGKSRPGARSY